MRGLRILISGRLGASLYSELDGAARTVVDQMKRALHPLREIPPDSDLRHLLFAGKRRLPAASIGRSSQKERYR